MEKEGGGGREKQKGREWMSERQMKPLVSTTFVPTTCPVMMEPPPPGTGGYAPVGSAGRRLVGPVGGSE